MHNKIDHFAIGTQSLDEGVAALQETLGVTVPRGGKHDAMSTHNCVMQSGNESFLELIAIDPEAPEPGRTRWFTLDDPATRARLAARPRALCWVVGTDDLDAVIAASPVSFGQFARYFRDVAKTPNALYLDGTVSSLWDPARGRMDTRADLGPLVVVETKE